MFLSCHLRNCVCLHFLTGCSPLCSPLRFFFDHHQRLNQNYVDNKHKTLSFLCSSITPTPTTILIYPRSLSMLCGGEGGVAMYLQQRGASFSRILGIKASMWQPKYPATKPCHNGSAKKGKKEQRRLLCACLVALASKVLVSTYKGGSKDRESSKRPMTRLHRGRDSNFYL